jgi:capsular polysaccharide biosynthesis protein
VEQVIKLSKRKTLIVLSSLAIVIVSSLSYLFISTPHFEISINPVDPSDIGVDERLED